MSNLEGSLIVTQEKGIHFRSMIEFNKICQRHSVNVVVKKQSTKLEASSSNTMGILLLCISKGDEVVFKISGEHKSSVEAAFNDFTLAFAA
jgi:phosphotransferase system HPr (HPr) family protein|tara:strand:- start:35021 stop:35293 length:273 start_codon:yes stop_codon:yes gene_type:complete